MTPLEYFRLLIPEFSEVSDSEVNIWLGMVGNLTEHSCLDSETASMADALFAGHLIYTRNQSGQGYVGTITMEKEGDLQRQYGSIKGSDTWLGSSPYGQWYMNVTAPCKGVSILTRVG